MALELLYRCSACGCYLVKDFGDPCWEKTPEALETAEDCKKRGIEIPEIKCSGCHGDVRIKIDADQHSITNS
jgi:hypothetical protein